MLLKAMTEKNKDQTQKKAVLFVIDRGKLDKWDTYQLLEELSFLALACEIQATGAVVQKRKNPDPAYYLGKGKLQELLNFALINNAFILICDDQLTPVQKRNIQTLFEEKLKQQNLPENTTPQVLDRPWLIMEIFAQRAKTKEAKLQVELAKARYEMTHLRGLGKRLSRLGGGIGTRGPGEQITEKLRRNLERKIQRLTTELKTICKQREFQRKKRKKAGLKQVSLVGYTNSGKSTLLSALSKDQTVYVANKLFATLDTLVRKIWLGEGKTFLLSDTVGFIRKLPPFLVASFRATLEEVKYADMLLHVVDISNPDYLEMIKVVEETLVQIGALPKKQILVLNKCDLCDKTRINTAIKKVKQLCETEEVVAISALKKQNLDKLLKTIEKQLFV